MSNAGSHQYPYMLHGDRVVVPPGSQHVQAGGPGGPFIPGYPANMAGIQGASGSTGGNAPNTGVVGVNPYQFQLQHASPIVISAQQPQGMHHHPMHPGAGAGQQGPSIVLSQMPDMPRMMSLMQPNQPHPGQMYIPQVSQATQLPSKRERKALPIKNPATGEDVVANMLQEQEKNTSSSSSTSNPSTASVTSTAGTATTSTATAKPAIVMSYPPGGQRPADNKRAPSSSAVRNTSAPTATTTPAAKESTTPDVTPTVSANLDNPDEFLPHLQKPTVAAPAAAAAAAPVPVANGE